MADESKAIANELRAMAKKIAPTYEPYDDYDGSDWSNGHAEGLHDGLSAASEQLLARANELDPITEASRG